MVPYANVALQRCQARFQPDKSSKTEQIFAKRQILEKGYEYNIQTHHFFIDYIR
jgi:hypothetical protein